MAAGEEAYGSLLGAPQLLVVRKKYAKKMTLTPPKQPFFLNFYT